MSMSKCIVRLKDAHGTEHSATVYADSLYEAVIRGLKMLEDVGWESDRDETISQKSGNENGASRTLDR
jgi:hypothetical protein